MVVELVHLDRALDVGDRVVAKSLGAATATGLVIPSAEPAPSVGIFMTPRLLLVISR